MIRTALSVKAVQSLPPGRHTDGEGLTLIVDPPREGIERPARRWVLRIYVQQRRRDIGLGGYPDISLARAREIARDMRAAAKEGRDPVEERRAQRAERTIPTFKAAAEQYFREAVEPTGKNAKHRAQWITTLRTYAFPKIGNRRVDQVTPDDARNVLLPIWLGKPETARRVRQRMNSVFEWACVSGIRKNGNPMQGIAKGLPKQPKKQGHFTALPYDDLPGFMDRLTGCEGVGALALRFTILTAARSGETRGATWDEIDLESGVWTIPAERMKAEKEHRVPLSPAALDILGQAKGLSDSLVFPGARKGKPMSDMTLAAVLKRLDVPVTVHGFRSTFRDWAAEQTSFPREIAEKALAHTVGDATERAYARSDLFDRRRELMEAWARFVAGGEKNVVQIYAASES